jgi:medium-chain acyl-[acyl-carrier-protein] hydrolase
MGDSKSNWLVDRLNPRARMRLFCLPYAGGGGAVYRTWQSSFPDGIEVCCVQLPGRESRFAEPLFTKMDPLVEALAEALVSALDRPFAFFGHSMGGLIAYELAKLLRHEYQMTPNHLFVSACHAPEIPDPTPHWHSLSDQELMAELRTLTSFPREALEHAELMQIMLPKIRADSAVTETYIYRPAEPFHFPLTAFASEQDEMIPREAIEPWRNHTRAAFDLVLVDGHHMFVQERSQQIIRVILGKLRDET